jgi:methionyl-tRNA formyltransferase
MKKLTLAYFGSPDFSAFFLEKILTDLDLEKLIDVKLVITQPDKPVGRKKVLTETPVKKVAKKYNLAIFEIENLKLFKNLKLKIKNFNLCLVYAFSHIIPQDLLSVPKLGFWNIHPSLLPKYRGPSPIAYPLIFGEKETGVTIIKMDEKIDHGPIIAQEKLKIEDTDRRPDLEKKLTGLGFLMFKELILNNFFNASTSLSINQFQLTPQADQNATYTRLLKREDGFIPLSTLKKALKNKPLNFEEAPKILKEIRNWKLEKRNSLEIIYNYFRGLYPWPGIWTLLPNGKRLKIIDMNFEVTSYKLQVTRVQLEGKKEVDFETFNQAYRVF